MHSICHSSPISRSACIIQMFLSKSGINHSCGLHTAYTHHELLSLSGGISGREQEQEQQANEAARVKGSGAREVMQGDGSAGRQPGQGTLISAGEQRALVSNGEKEAPIEAIGSSAGSRRVQGTIGMGYVPIKCHSKTCQNSQTMRSYLPLATAGRYYSETVSNALQCIAIRHGAYRVSCTTQYSVFNAM